MGHGTAPFDLLLHKVTIHERLDEFNAMRMAFKHNGRRSRGTFLLVREVQIFS
jgi:hypothetical protein